MGKRRPESDTVTSPSAAGVPARRPAPSHKEVERLESELKRTRESEANALRTLEETVSIGRKLSEELEVTRVEITFLRSELEVSRRVRDLLLKICGELTGDIEGVKSWGNVLLADKVAEHIQDLRAVNGRLTARVMKRDEEYHQAQEQILLLKSDCAEVNGSLETIREEKRQQSDAMNNGLAHIGELEAELSRLRTSNASLETQLTEQRASNEQAAKRILAMERDLNTWKEKAMLSQQAEVDQAEQTSAGTWRFLFWAAFVMLLVLGGTGWWFFHTHEFVGPSIPQLQ